MKLNPCQFGRAFTAAVILVLTSVSALAQTYTWKSVVIRGGGYVSGVVFHPTAQNLIYARTDVGGAYRWEQASGSWTPINDDLALTESQLMGVIAIAVDPNDANRVYLASGQYLDSWARTAAILRSNDRGNTWARTDVPFKLGGNRDGRGTAERLQVDPNNGTILFMGTNDAGLWKSTDRGVTWARVTAFAPTSTTFVHFDKRSGSAGNATQTIYVGVNGSGNMLYRSTNGGATWATVGGAPSGLIPNHADFDSNGILYVSYANSVGPNGMTTGGLWKLNTANGTWTNISPRPPTATDTFGYGAVSVSKLNAGTLVTTTNDRWGGGDEIWRSTDAGATWTNINNLDSYDNSSAPWIFSLRTSAFRPSWLTDVDMDPFNNNRVLFVTGAGIWGTDAAFGGAPVWTFRNNNLEETVVLELVSPPTGAPLLSALGDIGGFRHDNLDATPPVANFYQPVGGSNSSLDFAQAVPGTLVRATNGASRGAISTNSGSSWTEFAARPATATANGPGEIAINTNATRIVWNPEDSPAYFSTNNGASWTQSTGAPTGSFGVVADRVNANKFYIYDNAAGRVYVSTNGGQSFAAAGTVPGGGRQMRAVFGLEGNLWVPAVGGGLHRSTNSGASFAAVAGVQQAYALGFGKAASGQTHPAVYLWGRINDVSGLYRSDNVGATWTRINDNDNQWGWVNVVAGDPRVYGRVYIGTGGRGIIYGNLNAPNTPPTVSITSPANGATFTAGAAITINASATDSNGTVSSVAFFRGSTLISTDTTAPYSATWSSATAGTHALTAVATDNNGATTTSAAVSVTVGSGGGTTTTYQAEDAVIAGGVTVDTNNAGFNGRGFVNFPTTGGSVEFRNVNGGAGGTCTVVMRYANGSTSSRTGTRVVNGTTTSITCAVTGSWTTWVTQSFTVPLNAGTVNTIRFNSTGTDFGNLDQITVTTP